MTTIVWREWYDENAVRRLTDMGTLPRCETEINSCYMVGDDVAAEIAEKVNRDDSESFRDGGMLVIIEPEEFAGDYDIVVDWEPHFTAYKTEKAA